ncbi:MAG: hypothetical protein CVU88_00095 [Firmicutes bacterium HGW-Firmicutes-13]|nr:MAG: hypothetical protein CVU88_00095 [Firmicutes bacterium HGW-Firmicutes-13]
MNGKQWIDLLLDNWGKILGALTGLLLGLLFIWFGFWRTLFILICLTAGIFIGIRVERSNGFKNLIEKYRSSS